MTDVIEDKSRVNISLSGPASAAMDYISAKFPFRENMALTQVGLAYAIRCGIEPVRNADFDRPAGLQNMNLGSFDPANEIRNLIRVLYPEQGDPAVLAETLMNLGLVRLAADLRAGLISRISDLIFDAEEETAS